MLCKGYLNVGELYNLRTVGVNLAYGTTLTLANCNVDDPGIVLVFLQLLWHAGTF